MKEKKHIDRIFQERFKDFEVAPSDAVWVNIKTQLNQKKKKRNAVFIWWRYTGVAALLLLFLTIGRVYFNSTNSATPTNQVVDTKKTILSTENNTNNIEQVEQEGKQINANKKNNEPEIAKKNKKEHHTSTNFASSSAIANANAPSNTSISNTNNSNPERPKKDVAKAALIGQNNSIAVASNEKSKTDPIIDNTKNSSNNINKKQGGMDNDFLIANTKDQIDSTTIITLETKLRSIEEALAEAKNSNEEENPSNSKWSLAPNAAPVYFNSLGKGSSLDSQFNNNSKSGEINMSYGVTVGYTIAKNLKIRSGVNKVNLGYNTNDVIIFESLGSSINTGSSIKNIATMPPTPLNYEVGSRMSIISKESLKTSKNSSLIKTPNMSINQSLEYIEIPLEIEYSLINKKIGVNVIGGFSSLFLNSNKLYSEFNGERSLIGKATNLNTISYSANFGLGLNYKITKKVEFNLEPLFKYQINTFNNTSGNFNPYFIGVYTGIGFKF